MTAPAKAGCHVLMLTAAFSCAAAGAVLAQATFTAGKRTVAIYATVTRADGRLRRSREGRLHDRRQRQAAGDHDLCQRRSSRSPSSCCSIAAAACGRTSGSSRRRPSEFVDALRPADKARIGSFSNRIQVDPRDFTSNHERAARRFSAPSCSRKGRRRCGTRSTSGSRRCCTRRAAASFSSSPTAWTARCNGGSSNSLGDVMKRAEEEDVMVYAIGLAGSNGFGRRRIAAASRGSRAAVASAAAAAAVGRTDKPDPGLPKIAAATGGGYFELTSANDLAATFARVADELHHQYALGFTPTSARRQDAHARGACHARRRRRSRPPQLPRGEILT